MPQQIIKRRSRGLLCECASEGCRRNVERWVAGCEETFHGPGRTEEVLVIGASTGYGLASRIAAAWATGEKRWACFFERPPRRQDRNAGTTNCRVSLACRETIAVCREYQWRRVLDE